MATINAESINKKLEQLKVYIAAHGKNEEEASSAIKLISQINELVQASAKCNALTAISPIDGRYAKQNENLKTLFSEYGFMRYRVDVEVRYFIALMKQLEKSGKTDDLERPLTPTDIAEINKIATDFTVEEAMKVKEIEATTNHDIKAIEYYIAGIFKAKNLPNKNFIHFAITSQDICNPALTMILFDYMTKHYLPLFLRVHDKLSQLSKDWTDIKMLARTHGQPATPITLGYAINVFKSRLFNQITHKPIFTTKFGGATGMLNAHRVAYPSIDWNAFADEFIKSLRDDDAITRQEATTQIENYDEMASLFHLMIRINTILINLCRDIWTYISMNYLKLKVVATETGSSTMPHKVNPIDFENAEGNLGVANALFEHFAKKLPDTKLQRDLTDSTVCRGIGTIFGHVQVALNSIFRGLNKIEPNLEKIKQDLEDHPEILGEADQTILRRENYPDSYEFIKSWTRGQKVTMDSMHAEIDKLENISDAVKQEMKKITVFNY